MAITQKQENYARLVASGMDLHTAALEAGCKNHESARKFVADMAKRENVQAFIAKLKAVQNGLGQNSQDHQKNGSSTPAQSVSTNVKYETPLEYLTAVFNNVDGVYLPKERISAAIALLPPTPIWGQVWTWIIWPTPSSVPKKATTKTPYKPPLPNI